VAADRLLRELLQAGEGGELLGTFLDDSSVVDVVGVGGGPPRPQRADLLWLKDASGLALVAAPGTGYGTTCQSSPTALTASAADARLSIPTSRTTSPHPAGPNPSHRGDVASSTRGVGVVVMVIVLAPSRS
jgi:hypothetical protein